MRALQKSAGLSLSTVTLHEWERIKELFEVVLGLAPDRRAAFLDENCPGDATVRADVEKLLAEYEKVEPLVENTVTLSMRPAALDKAGRVTFTGRCCPIGSASCACWGRAAWAKCTRRKI
jgi:hypothetical protein